MTTPTAASLLHLVDRAERGSLLAEEAQQLRNGIRALAVRDQEMEQLRAELDRVHLRACRTAEALRVAEDQRDRIRTQLLKVLTRAEQAEAAIERVRALHREWKRNETDPSPGYCAHCEKDDDVIRWPCPTLAALDQPQQPTEDEARQQPCSLWLLSNGHVPHWWQPQPGMADVLCPGAPRKAAATRQQPTTMEADRA